MFVVFCQGKVEQFLFLTFSLGKNGKSVFNGVMGDPVALSENEARFELEKQFKEMIQELLRNK